MATIAVLNQKGGVGKTTVTLGLAAAACSRGLRVLVADLDPQANATSGLGIWDVNRSMDDVLASDESGSIRSVVIPAGWPPVGGSRPDVVPSAPALAQREPQLATDPIGAQDRLALALRGVDDYDLILIDCPPSLSLLTVNALFAADRALIVTEPAAWARDGVEQVLGTVRRVGERRGGALTVAGLLVNRLGRTRDARYWAEQLAEDYPDLRLPTVDLRAAVAEASAQAVPLHALGNRPGASKAIEQFDAVLEALLDPSSSSDPSSDSSTTSEVPDGLRPTALPVPPSN